MLTRRKTLFRSLPFRATYSSKMNAQMPHTNNCIVCTVIIPSFSISVSLHIFLSLYICFFVLTSISFRLLFALMVVLIFFQYYDSTSRDEVYEMRRAGVSVIVILLYYYVCWCCFVFHIFRFRFILVILRHPSLVRERANRVALIHFSSLQSIPS